MNATKVGMLIKELRKEKRLTQQQLADKLFISNKTISKWECGLGYPDVSLWEKLSELLGTDIFHLLKGDLEQKEIDPGKLSKIFVYNCPKCNSISIGTSEIGLICCGKKLHPLSPEKPTNLHSIHMVEKDNEYSVSIVHEMTKAHYISFSVLVDGDRYWFLRLYPEQSLHFFMPRLYGRGNLYLHCTKHGLFVYPLKELLDNSR